MEILKAADLPDTLIHYTDGAALNSILGKGRIELRASRVDKFWNKQPHHTGDDSSEFAGFVKLLRLTENITRYSVEKGQRAERGMEKGFGSSLSPYILCFAKGERVSEDLFKHFSNGQADDSIQMALVFHADSLLGCQDGILVSDDNHIISASTKKSRIEVFPIEYVKASVTDSEDLDRTDANAKLQLFKEKFTKIFTEKFPDESEETDIDHAMDSCFYLKHEKFAMENEVRYLYREEKDFKFNIHGDTYLSQSNDTDRHRYITFPVSALKEVVFSKKAGRRQIQKFVGELFANLSKAQNSRFMHELMGVTFKTSAGVLIPMEAVTENNQTHS